jgi:competence protein ComEC
MRNLLNALTQELENYFLWIPVFLGIGILIFFNLPFDPSLMISFASLVGLSGLLFLTRKNYLLLLLICSLWLINLGFISGQVRTLSVASPVLKEKTEEHWIEGNVADIQYTDKGVRLLLQKLSSRTLDIEFPQKVRVSVRTKTNGAEVGDRIVVKAILMPPPEPIIPKGVDFAEYAYFKQIGAIGFAISNLKVIEKQADISSYASFVNWVRRNVIDRINNTLPKTQAAIASGLLVGDASAIEKSDFESIRISGIAHIIAISGMHIVIVVGMIFLSIRFVLSRFEYITLNFNIKKIASICAILGSYIYLELAGSPVSAQRAFIMSSLVLLAILLDKNASPMRSIAISAILILLVTPETLLSASLQMSFAACIALIAGFELSNKFIISRPQIQNKFINKIVGYFISIIFASFVAGLATAPFVVYHFQQFSTYGILTNIFAVPLSDFFIMPLGMLGLLLMPFHLEPLALVPMGFGIDIMLQYAKFISTLPKANIYVPSFTGLGILSITLGFLILCFFVSKYRLVGVLPIILGFTTIYNYEKPDILIDSEGKLFAILYQGELVVSSKQSAKFVRNAWASFFGEKEVVSIDEKDLEDCGSELCEVSKNNLKVIIVKDEKLLDYACKSANLLINLTSENIKCAAADSLINLTTLKSKGAHSIWLSKKGLRVASVSEFRSRRAWHN